MADPVDNPQGVETPAAQQITQPNPVEQQEVSILNKDGSFVENWYAKYPQDYHPTLSRFKKFDDYVDSSMDARKKLGHNPESLVVIPSEDSPDEVKNEFITKVYKRPEKPEDYEYILPKELEERINIVSEEINSFKKFAYEKLHLDNDKFQAVLDYYHKKIVEAEDVFEEDFKIQKEQKRQDGIKVLEAEFGEGLQERTLRAEGILNKYGQKLIKSNGDEKAIVELLEEEIPAVKTSPYLRLILDSIAEDMAPARIGNVHTISTQTPADIDSKVAELRAHPAYMDRNHPEHKSVNTKVETLLKQKTGGK